MGYRLCAEPGKPMRSSDGHIYFREDGNSPIIRLSHKAHTIKEAEKRIRCRLSKRQMMKLIAREAASRTIAAKFQHLKA